MSTANVAPPPPKITLPRQFQDIPIVVSLYHLYHSFHETLITFPKSERYSLGATCQNEILTLTKHCLRAAGTSNHEVKLRYLQEASVNLDSARLLLSLAKDCKCLPNQTYQQLDARLSEIGRMLGGWLKSISSSP